MNIYLTIYSWVGRRVNPNKPLLCCRYTTASGRVRERVTRVAKAQHSGLRVSRFTYNADFVAAGHREPIRTCVSPFLFLVNSFGMPVPKNHLPG